MSPEIVDRVDERWSEYGFTGETVPSRFARTPEDGTP